MTLYRLYTEPLKRSLKVETQSWREMLCRYLKDEFGKKMTDTSVKNEDHLQQLSIPVANLEDVRRAMAILSKFRDTEIDTDMTLISIEVQRPQKTCLYFLVLKREIEMDHLVLAERPKIMHLLSLDLK